MQKRRLLFLIGAAMVLRCGTMNAAPKEPLADRFTVAGCSLPNQPLPDVLAAVKAMEFAGVEIATFADNAKTNAPDTSPWVVVDELSAEEKVKLKAAVA